MKYRIPKFETYTYNWVEALHMDNSLTHRCEPHPNMLPYIGDEFEATPDEVGDIRYKGIWYHASCLEEIEEFKPEKLQLELNTHEREENPFDLMNRGLYAVSFFQSEGEKPRLHAYNTGDVRFVDECGNKLPDNIYIENI